MASSSFYYLLLLLFSLTVNHVLASLLLEDGYEVTTVFKGNKHGIHPYFILPMFGSSDLIFLDSSRSTFYTLSLATSQEGSFETLTGNGVAGYADGELGSAMFNKSKNFAVDFKGNIYVPDKFKHTIRKISKSGVTTIAGGYSQKAGKKDGPAQNASFSDDFELAFIPKRCSIMISDHGNSLVREMKLKTEDCTHTGQSGVGMASFWALGLGFACLLGMIVGFVARPYITSCGGSVLLMRNMTWNLCLISLENRVVMLCFVIRSVVVNSTLYRFLTRLILLSLSCASLMLRIRRVEPKTSCNKLPSLLDFDDSKTYCKNLPSLLDIDGSKSCKTTKLQLVGLKDLMTFDEVVESSAGGVTNVVEEDIDKESTNLSSGRDKRIESLIRANVLGFMEQPRTGLLDESVDCSKGLVKRKGM